MIGVKSRMCRDSCVQGVHGIAATRAGKTSRSLGTAPRCSDSVAAARHPRSVDFDLDNDQTEHDSLNLVRWGVKSIIENPLGA